MLANRRRVLAGALSAAIEFPPPPPEPTDNAALSATVTCSYSSPWERCEVVKSGDDPASSNIPAANIGTRWGTWPQGGTHWVQDVPDSFNGGVKGPEQWSIEYWDSEGWVEVGNPSEYGLELNTYNRTTFDRVTTTRLRAVLQTRTTASGTGALEWKVYSVEPSSVDAVHVTTPVGVPPELPETVTLRYDDGERLDAGVWWRPFDDDLLGQPGTFTVTGVIENNLVEAEATVVVDTCPDGYSAEQSVTFSDLDSGVPNRDRGDGCTFLDLVWSQAPFADHGAFVAAVEIVKGEYEAAGLITGREGGTIMVTAAQAIDAWREGPPDPR